MFVENNYCFKFDHVKYSFDSALSTMEHESVEVIDWLVLIKFHLKSVGLKSFFLW